MFPITRVLILVLTTPFVAVLGAPAIDANSLKQNGISAQQLNAQFASLKKTDSCQGSDMACVEGSFAQCVSGKWQTTECAGGTQCFVLPLVNKVGTSISCDTQADAEARIGDTGASGGLTGLGSSGSSFAAVNSSFDDNCTDSNSATSPAATQTGALDAYETGTSSDNATNTSAALAAATSNSDCAAAVTTTVTVTFAASSFAASFSAAPTRSATIAPGFTLPPGPTSTAYVSGENATATSSGISSPSTNGSSSAYLSSAQTGTATAIPAGYINATITLSPASASSLLSSLAAANPGITISTVGDSPTSAASAVVTASPVTGDNAASASSSGPGSLSLSFFSTTLASVTASANDASSTAAAFASPSTSAAAGGYGGSGY